MSVIAKNNIGSTKSPVALVAPLDWGLGHATRCIPIIYELLNAGFEVFIAAEGDQKDLLALEFPGLTILPLKGYRMSYGTKWWITPLKILIQIPKILTAINKEKRWLHELNKKKHLDIIISDNRFGLHYPGIYSVFITHQLNIQTPFGELANRFLLRLNYRHINKFSCCWIPDFKSETNLGGILSHPSKLPAIPVQYIGILSRIKKRPLPLTNKILVIISGPEPQRAIFENKVLLQLKESGSICMVVLGLPSLHCEKKQIGSITVYNHLPSRQMEELINQSEIIISRSGYSTVMDLLPLGKKCIFIPTPGQTEQEYLAEFLASKNWCITDKQDRFSIPELIEKTAHLTDIMGILPDKFQTLKQEIIALASRFG